VDASTPLSTRPGWVRHASGVEVGIGEGVRVGSGGSVDEIRVWVGGVNWSGGEQAVMNARSVKSVVIHFVAWRVFILRIILTQLISGRSAVRLARGAESAKVRLPRPNPYRGVVQRGKGSFHRFQNARMNFAMKNELKVHFMFIFLREYSYRKNTKTRSKVHFGDTSSFSTC